MKKRVVPFTISAALALFLCLGFVLGTAAGRAPAYRYLTVFAQVLDLVRGNYVDQVDDQALLRGAYQGMLAGLDSYSGYFPADEYARLVKEPEGPADAGFEVVKDGAALAVVAVWPGSSAERVGVKVGDRVWTIDGATTRDMSLMQARRRLSGGDGSEELLQIFRGAERKRQEFRLKRNIPQHSPFEARVETGGIGYLRLRNPARAGRDSLAVALKDLERRGARKLLLDLRGATRGGMDDALRIAGLFIGEQTVVRSVERGGLEVEHHGKGPALCKLPTWVLVNRGTAGASEILAAALRDRFNAKLLGEKTCGFGARQEMIRLPAGDGLVLSVARYLSPAGSGWHGEGLKENVAIPLSAPDKGADPEEKQLRRALELVAAEGAAAAAKAA